MIQDYRILGDYPAESPLADCAGAAGLLVEPCPLTFACDVKDLGRYTPALAFSAAAQLGLGPFVTAEIIAA